MDFYDNSDSEDEDIPQDNIDLAVTNEDYCEEIEYKPINRLLVEINAVTFQKRSSPQEEAMGNIAKFTAKSNFISSLENEQIKLMIEKLAAKTGSYLNPLMPIHFVYLYYLYHRIAFSDSILSYIMIIARTSFIEDKSETYMNSFCELMDISDSKYIRKPHLDAYIRGFMILIRVGIAEANDQGLSNFIITKDDNDFLKDTSSYMTQLHDRIQLIAYRIFPLGYINQCFNASSLDKMFDLMIRLLIEASFSEGILPNALNGFLQRFLDEKVMGRRIPISSNLYAIYRLEINDYNENILGSKVINES